MNERTLFLALASFCWLAFGLIITTLRPDTVLSPEKIIGAGFGFLLIGLFSSFLLLSFLEKRRAGRGRIPVLIAYTLASPLSYFFGIGGLVILEVVPTTETQTTILYFLFPLAIGVWGTLPLALAMGVGNFIGITFEKFSTHHSQSTTR